jgi:phosphotransferase system  glucose/maltose/N-acetylglucosamine-specific IIC component
MGNQMDAIDDARKCVIDSAKQSLNTHWDHWDLSQERAFIENLLGQRFNFLLIFFSIFVAGAVEARDSALLQACVLSLGAVISIFLVLAIRRAQEKLDLILDILFATRNHPVAVINKLATKRSRRKLIGHLVPIICAGSLFIWSLGAWAGMVAQVISLPAQSAPLPAQLPPQAK